MTENNESRERLIACAKKEFLEKGFAKASLRSICSEAGFTTGAVYFFFKDKNGLFAAVVGDTYDRLFELIRGHLDEEEHLDSEEFFPHKGDHDDLSDAIVDHLYDHYDEMLILIDKAQGSQFEDIVDRVISLFDESYLRIAERYASLVGGKRVNHYMLHWQSHLQAEAFQYLLTHVTDKEDARIKMKKIMDILIKMWMASVLEDAD